MIRGTRSCHRPAVTDPRAPRARSQGALAVLLALALPACATVEHAAVPGSALQARAVQSRSFEGTDARVVLKAVVDVLQDDGFVIREADAELGIVTAVKQWRSRRVNKGLRIAKWLVAPATYGASLLVPSGGDEFTTVEAIVNVSQARTQAEAATRVRVSLVAKVADAKGRLRSVTPVDDALAYQGVLARVDKAVYLQKEGL